MTLILIQYALDVYKFVFKFIWLATSSNLFSLEGRQKYQQCQFREFRKKTRLITKNCSDGYTIFLQVGN